MQTCPFCTIDNIKTRIIDESKQTRVILSNPRLTKGHLLVIPKRHIEQPWDITSSELKELFSHIHHFQKKLSITFGTGCDIRQHFRPFMQQGRLKVDHLHFHLLPRTYKDELYEESMKFETDLFKNLTEQEIIEVTTSLKKTE